MMWLASMLRNYRVPLEKDFLEAGLSLQEIGFPEKRRGTYLSEAYLFIKDSLTIPGSWLYAELADEYLPITLQEEAAYAAARVQWSYITSKGSKKGKPQPFEHGLFKDAKKARKRKKKEALSTLSQKEREQLRRFDGGEEEIFSAYTTEKPQNLRSR